MAKEEKRWFTLTPYGGKYETIFKNKKTWEKLGYEISEGPDEVHLKRKNGN